MTQKESLALVISRFELQVPLIPPLKVIIPMLNNMYTVRVFTSLDGEIVPPKGTSVYDDLVKKLQNNCGFCSLTKTLEGIIKQYDSLKSNNYRVCILGHERVDWGIIMEFKRRSVVVDTVCGSPEKNHLLVQISYITGGIHKTVNQSTMIKTFQTELGMNSKIRHMFKMEKKQTVQFSLECCICHAQINQNFFACSVCLGVYCLKHENIAKCALCTYLFD